MTRPRPRHRGFALLIALALLALSAAAVVALSSLLAVQAQRTRAAVEDAQLRQLLTAGAATVCADARHWTQPPAAGELPEIRLPRDLRDAHRAGIRARVIATSGDEVRVKIEASIDARSAEEILSWAKLTSGYSLQSVAAAP